MRLDFAPASHLRDIGLPESRLVGMFPEPTPAGPGKSARLSWPGLEAVCSFGLAGVQGLFRRQGAFDGHLFAVSGTTLYRGTTPLGTVALGPHAEFSASPTQLVVTVGGHAYCYDGTVLSEIDVDGQRVSGHTLAGDRWYFPVEGSDRCYFSDLDDATAVDPLSFFTADSFPDSIVSLGAQKDRVLFWGAESTEYRHQTGDQDAPLIRTQGSTQGHGLRSNRAKAFADNRWFWVSHTLQVVTEGAPDIISTPAVDEDLRLCTDPANIVGFPVVWNGHAMVGFNVPGRRTWVYHIPSGTWHERRSHGRDTFRCDSTAMADGETYLGDRLSGTVFRLAQVYSDNGDPLERMATVIAPPGQHHRLELFGSKGVGLVGNAPPQVEMRYSNDYGQTWNEWRARSMGLIGAYSHRTRWDRLGLARRERVYQFRCTDPVSVTFTHVDLT